MVRKICFVLAFQLLYLTLLGQTDGEFDPIFTVPKFPQPTETAHAFHVDVVAFNLDGTKVFSSGLDNTIKIWDASQGKNIRQISSSNCATQSIAFSRDGKSVACALHYEGIVIYDADLKKIKTRLKGNNPRVRQVIYGEQGKFLFTASENGEIKIWDATNYWLIKTLYSTNRLQSLAVSKNEDKVIAGIHNGNIEIWDLRTEKKITIPAHRSGVSAVAIQSHLNEFISAGSDYKIKIWDINTGQLKDSIACHQKSIFQLRYFKKEKRFASLSWDHKIILFNARTGKPMREVVNDSQIRCIDISPDDKFLIAGTADKKILKLDIKTGEVVLEFK